MRLCYATFILEVEKSDTNSLNTFPTFPWSLSEKGKAWPWECQPQRPHYTLLSLSWEAAPQTNLFGAFHSELTVLAYGQGILRASSGGGGGSLCRYKIYRLKSLVVSSAGLDEEFWKYQPSELPRRPAGNQLRSWLCPLTSSPQTHTEASIDWTCATTLFPPDLLLSTI